MVFPTSKELEHVHLFVINSNTLFLALNDRTSNFEHSSTNVHLFKAKDRMFDFDYQKVNNEHVQIHSIFIKVANGVLLISKLRVRLLCLRLVPSCR